MDEQRERAGAGAEEPEAGAGEGRKQKAESRRQKAEGRKQMLKPTSGSRLCRRIAEGL